jgi:hypothetical protein
MRFFVIRQRREGCVIPRHALRIEAQCVNGELRVMVARDPVMHRMCRIARLVQPDNPHIDVLPQLKDATLLYIDSERMVLTGFEQVLDRDFAQTWMLTHDPDALHSLHSIASTRDR